MSYLLNTFCNSTVKNKQKSIHFKWNCAYKIQFLLTKSQFKKKIKLKSTNIFLNTSNKK